MRIEGSISRFMKGFEGANMKIDTLLGLPINDETGRKIGEIVELDEASDIWYAHINDKDIRELKIPMIGRPTKRRRYNEELD